MFEKPFLFDLSSNHPADESLMDIEDFLKLFEQTRFCLRD